LIQKIHIGGLLEFYESSAFKELPVIPISKNRVASYINNPRKIDKLPILYLYFDQSKLVGFRSILADTLKTHGTTHPFGWLSGSWVHPDYRRLGIATLLLREVLKDWGFRMLFTNYAPAAKALFDKSGQFTLFEERKGLRLYLRFTLAELLESKHLFFKKSKKVWGVLDSILNGIFSPYYLWQKIRLRIHSPDVPVFDKLDESHYSFINKHSGSVFNRTQPEYEWIFKYPWVKTVREETAEYPFSHVARQFGYFVLTTQDPQNGIAGLAIGKIRDGHVTFPYLEVEEEYLKTMADQILKHAEQRRCTRLTVYHPKMVSYFQKKRGLGLLKKPMIQHYFITKSFLSELPVLEHPLPLQDGDGDCVFT
jgi:ribosomal protein S18 acetylase RimI-like enzyme